MTLYDTRSSRIRLDGRPSTEENQVQIIKLALRVSIDAHFSHVPALIWRQFLLARDARAL